MPEIGLLTLEVALAPRHEYLSVGLAPNVSVAALAFILSLLFVRVHLPTRER